MFRSLKLIFSPDQEWEKMSLQPPSAWVVFFASILPLVVGMLAIEALGLLKWGAVLNELGKVRVPEERVYKYAIFYGLAAVLVILAGAALLKNVAPSFNLRSGYGAYFTLMAYGFAPLLLVRPIDAIPQINTWVVLAIGCMLALRVLYHGVGHWLKPEQTKGLGVFMVTIMYTLVLGGLVHFASFQVLKGRLLKNLSIPHEAAEIKSHSSTPP
jgi:hypothetical protein